MLWEMRLYNIHPKNHQIIDDNKIYNCTSQNKAKQRKIDHLKVTFEPVKENSRNLTRNRRNQ